MFDTLIILCSTASGVSISSSDSRQIFTKYFGDTELRFSNGGSCPMPLTEQPPPGHDIHSPIAITISVTYRSLSPLSAKDAQTQT